MIENYVVNFDLIKVSRNLIELLAKESSDCRLVINQRIILLKEKEPLN